MMIWANTFDGIPEGITIINFEYLPADTVGMALSTVQSTHITSWDILGNYTAEYQFSVFYRVKPGNSNDKRLQAVELLNAFGDWALTAELPDIGDNLEAVSIVPTTRASMFAIYENGDEDYQIALKMVYSAIM